MAKIQASARAIQEARQSFSQATGQAITSLDVDLREEGSAFVCISRSLLGDLFLSIVVERQRKA